MSYSFCLVHTCRTNRSMYLYTVLIYVSLFYRPAFTQADCGEDIKVNVEGTLTSPNYPGTYNVNTTCIWRLRVPPGDRVVIKFQTFVLEDHSDCGFDYVEVRDGDTQDSPLIGKFCGNKLPPTISSSGNTLLIKFKTDHSQERTGFSAVFMKAVCGGDIEVSEERTLTSPNHSEDYGVNLTCVWRLRSPSDDHLAIKFQTFVLEDQNSCEYDYVEVRDGDSQGSPLIGKYCGNKLPPTVSASGNRLLIKFKTDHSAQRTGFSAILMRAVCGRDIEVNEEGILRSPNYPETYEANMDCIWKLRGPPGEHLAIEFETFVLEDDQNCAYDYVEVRDGNSLVSPLLGKFCGNRLPPNLYSSGNMLLIKFRADHSYQRAGFSAVYMRAVCGRDIEVNEEGILRSPNYPETYEANMDCIWKLRGPPGEHLAIKFGTFVLEDDQNCAYDYVEVRDGNSLVSPLLGKFCGNRLPPNLYSSGNMLLIKFRADHSYQRAGFSAVYMRDLCGGEIEVNERGSLTSPNYPGNYRVNTTCVWMLRVPSGYHVAIKFRTFVLEDNSNCSFDYVEVRDGDSLVSPLIGKYCGETLPPNLSSSGNTLLIKFRSDHSQQRAGFSADFMKADCGRDIEVNKEGKLTSPNYPGVYEVNTTCIWRLRDPSGYHVAINFQKFELEDHSNCNFDYVEVRDGDSLVSPLIGKFCGNKLPPNLSSSGNTLLIKFRSDYSQQRAGFSADFMRADCGRDIEVNEVGKLMSPNHPGTYEVNTTCIWRLRVPPSDHVFIKFQTFVLENHSSCDFDYVEVRDGDSLESPLVGKYCGDTLPPNLSSSGNKLLIKFRTDHSQQRVGFSAIFMRDNYITTVHSTEERISETDEVTTVYSIGKIISGDFAYVHLTNKTSASVFTSLLIGDRIVDLTKGHQENLENWKYLLTETGGSECRFVQPVIPGSDSSLSKYFTFNQFTFLRFEIVDCEIALKLILTSSEEPVSLKTDFYYITSDNCTSFNIYKCNNTYGPEIVVINNEPFMCWKVETFSIINTNGRSELKWFIKQTEGKITIWYFRVHSETPEYVWNTVIDSPKSMKFFAIYASDPKRKKNVLSEVSSWGLNHYNYRKNISLKGQWFIPVHNNMCITLIFYTRGNFSDIFHIYFEQRNSSQTTFMGVAGKSSKKGWQIENKLLTWPEGIQNSEIRLTLNTSYDNVVIEKVYTSQMDDTDGCTSGDGGKNQCGFPVHSCPPGFTGADCEQGCGKNRFGKDCNSMCSTHSEGCSGLLLCTPSVGCVCPPGYKGQTCEEECESGFYGNNCSESCGNCKEGACDIYTGECWLCQPGYYLPLCKHKYAVTSSPPHVNVTAFGKVIVTPDFRNITGKTHPEFYSVEYRKVLPFNPWIKYTTLAMPENGDPPKTIIQSLEHGVRYEVRIVLIDRDHNRYEEDGYIPVTNFFTQCIIPDDALKLLTYSNETSVTVYWQFENDETNSSNYWCPVRYFEVYWKEGWMWFTVNTTDNTFSLHNQLPSMTYEFRVRAATCCGFTLYSPSTFVSTATSFIVTEPVRNIEVTERGSHSANIRWDPPLSFNIMELSYVLEYKCMIRSACLKNCSESAGTMYTTNTSVRLSDLLSFSQYLVMVSANGGPINNVIFATTMSDPIEIPVLDSEMLSRTNTSITVYWRRPEVCSGIFEKYLYQVYLESDLLRNGVTSDTSAAIDHLIPRTEYKIRICVQLISGRVDLDKCLEINVSTAASVPEKVENLTVYKQGQSMLGIRWAQPKNVEGTLKFTVTTELNGVVIKFATIQPIPCIIWPDMFCYSITSLKANKVYTVSVSAKSNETNANGPPATVTGVTKEKLPLAPENFKLIDVSSTSVVIKWDYPFVANGILRSFVLNIEETERFEAEKCCEVYPLAEIPNKEELEHYVTEISDLKPASTYVFSLSAKTIGLGPFQKLNVHTRPPQLPATLPNVTINFVHEDWHWQSISDSKYVYSYEVYKPLIKEPMLLLVVSDDAVFNETGIKDAVLDKELKSVIPENFYLTAEYTDEALDINIGDNAITDGKWGKVRNIPFQQQKVYQIAAVRVTEYKSIYNAAISLSSTIFTQA